MIRFFTRTCVAMAFAAALPAMGLAQNEDDVLRYGWVAPLGSSRTMAMGGAFGALGGDLGSMGINPAGLGLYRRGDLAITTGLNSANTDASWNTTSAASAKFQGTTSNLGVALTYPSVDADWPFFTLAVGRQVRMPFNQRIFIEGVPSESTVSDLFVQQALDDAAIYGYASTDEALGGGDIFPYSASLAWRTLLLLPDNDDIYATAVGGPVEVKRVIERSGRMWETQIGFGTCYRDRLSIGATLGLPKVEFEETSTHQETTVSAEDDLRAWDYNERLNVDGQGILLRAGVNWRVTSQLRLGLAHQTRGRMTLLDNYSTSLSTQWADGNERAASSPITNNEYLVYTPRRTTVSASFLMGKLGVLAADYVHTDLRDGELGDPGTILSSGYNYAAENVAVDSSLQIVREARVGLELRLGPSKEYRIRMGGGTGNSPFNPNGVATDGSRHHASFGAEYRIGDVHFSVAWRRTWHKEDYLFMGAFHPESRGTLDRTSAALMFGAGLRL